MDKNTLAANIDHQIAVSYKKKESLKAFSESVNLLNDIYSIDKREAFSVLAIMQSVVVGFTVDNSGDDPTLKEIITEAEEMLSKYVKGKKEGMNAETTYP